MAITINNQKLENALKDLAKKENRSPENMAETVLKDYVSDYTGITV